MKEIPKFTKKEAEFIKRRFEAYVYKSDDCWLWCGCFNSGGYGRFRFKSRTIAAHRVAFLLYRHNPKDLLVCHSCDTPPCVNPSHLFLGTHTDNIRDSIKKGRMDFKARFESQWKKLTMCRKRLHKLEPGNIYININSGDRRCRTCRSIWDKKKRNEIKQRKKLKK